MRARNIKPGFFRNEVLGTATVHAQLLFAGLWMLADRDGRLEDRPLRIKAEIFPYREGLVIDEFLTELASLGFITRYEVGGSKFIQIENFKKHQTPHKTEKLSEIPSKQLNNNSSSASYVKEEIITAALPPDSLIPDSLIPDSRDGDKSPEVDLKQIIFGKGLEFISSRTGKPPDKLRGLVGKWISQYGDQRTLSAIMDAQRASAIEPVSYIEKALKGNSNATHSQHTAKPTWKSEQDRLRESILAEAEREHEASLAGSSGEGLRIAEAIRQIPN